MKRVVLRMILFFMLTISIGLNGTRCAPSVEKHVHGDFISVKTYPKDYVHPLTEINLEKVIHENRGLKVMEENARTVYDYYRGGVQEKAEGEILMKQSKWEEARIHIEKSNRFLQVVLDYIPKDEAYRNLYGDHVVIFLPNLLIADNYLKLIRIYHEMKMEDEAYWASREGKKFLSSSLRSVKTEWGFQIRRELEQAFQKK